ncbi:hypothetical protein [Myxosarcina sp. GI1]|uniref:hypothetical protein n=1 Tax=Myxosarcina sp. GI1 TaxID=1541065 RepID=UPI00056371B4|nr:hypothetical protein [Myxosarcina sp. GI1]
MPIDKYGVWVAKPIRVSAERAAQDPRSPHIHLFRVVRDVLIFLLEQLDLAKSDRGRFVILRQIKG